jgi:hypothetical protein
VGSKSGGLERKTTDLQWSPPTYEFFGTGRKESRKQQGRNIRPAMSITTKSSTRHPDFRARRAACRSPSFPVVALKSHDDNKVIGEGGIPHVPFPCRLFLFLVIFCTPLSRSLLTGSTCRCPTSLSVRVGFLQWKMLPRLQKTYAALTESCTGGVAGPQRGNTKIPLFVKFPSCIGSLGSYVVRSPNQILPFYRHAGY